MEEQSKGHCRHGEFVLTEGCPKCIAERRAAQEAEKTGTIPKDVNVLPMFADETGPAVDPPVSIVKVKYYSGTTGKYSDREYAYFSVDRLGVGQLVQAPVGDNRVVKAVVTATDVPEAEIEAFRERVKTIPSGSIRPGPASSLAAAAEAAGAEVTEAKVKVVLEDETNRGPSYLQDNAPTPGPYNGTPTLFDQKPEPEPEAETSQEEFKGVPFGEGVVATSSEGPVTYHNKAEDIDLEAAIHAEEQRPPALATIETQVGASVLGLFQLYQEAAGLLQFAKARVIATNEDLKPATNDLAIIATCKKAMFARKTEFVGPLKAKLDLVNQAFADLMFPVEEADRLTRGQVAAFDNEQRRKAAEAKRIEDEKFKLAQDEAALTGTGEHTQELGTAVAPPPAPERTRTDLGTLGGRDNWKARVVNFALLSDEWKIPNESLLNSHARTTKGTRPISGVEFYNDRSVTMRTK